MNAGQRCYLLMRDCDTRAEKLKCELAHLKNEMILKSGGCGSPKTEGDIEILKAMHEEQDKKLKELEGLND